MRPSIRPLASHNALSQALSVHLASPNALSTAHIIADVGDTSLYAMPSDVLLKLSVSSWKYNRPHDQDRVAEIRGRIAATGFVDGTIRLADLNGKLVCFDGNHRRLALVAGLKCVLVTIINNATHERIVEEFSAINKAVSVPELYKDSRLEPEERLVLIGYADRLARDYPTMQSKSARCCRPHYHRDTLLDDLYELLPKYSSASVLVQCVTEQNAALAVSARFRSNLSPSILKKCESSGLWLFAESRNLSL